MSSVEMRRTWLVMVSCATVAIAAAIYAQTNIVGAVRSAIAANDLARAEQIARSGLAGPGAGPHALEALSWVARGALAAGDLNRASRIAMDTQARAESALKTRALDAEPSLPI